MVVDVEILEFCSLNLVDEGLNYVVEVFEVEWGGFCELE